MSEENQSLRERFNDLGRHPAHRFEARHGISGIAGDYVFPDKMTAAAYEDRYTWEFSPDGGIARSPGILQQFYAPERHLTGDEITGGVAEFVEKQSSLQYRSLLAEGWRQLEEANPQLKKLTFNRANGGELYNALMGVTSGFNPQDIDFFLQLRRENKIPGKYVMSQPAFKAHLDWMENKVSVCDRPCWVPSLPTLEKIRDKLEQKYGR